VSFVQPAQTNERAANVVVDSSSPCETHLCGVHNGRIITDGNEICNYVNDYFSTIGSRMASSISAPTDADIHTDL